MSECCHEAVSGCRYSFLRMSDLAIKFLPLLAVSSWMSFNLRYEKDPVQYRKNTKIELFYCLVQVSILLFGHYSKLYFLGTLLLIIVALYYILIINPKYMNRQLTKSRNKKTELFFHKKHLKIFILHEVTNNDNIPHIMRI